MAKGHIRARGPGAWELKYDIGVEPRDRPAHHSVQDGARGKTGCTTRAARHPDRARRRRIR